MSVTRHLKSKNHEIGSGLKASKLSDERNKDIYVVVSRPKQAQVDRLTEKCHHSEYFVE